MSLFTLRIHVVTVLMSYLALFALGIVYGILLRFNESCAYLEESMSMFGR